MRVSASLSRPRRGIAVLAALVVPLLIGMATPIRADSPHAVAMLRPASAPRVLLVGDSTTVHMRDLFAWQLRARGLLATVDAVSGRTTREGRAVVASYDRSRYDYVVVLLGSNGKRANAKRDMRALRAMGVDTMATVQAPRQRTVNRAVRAVFGAKRITWAGYAKAHGIRTVDRKHYSRAGYRARAAFLAREISVRAHAAARIGVLG